MNKFILQKQKSNNTIFSDSIELPDFILSYSGILFDLRNNKDHGFILLGDCINTEDLPDWSMLTVENEPKGNYYIFHITEHEIFIKSSGFSMLPVFYNKDSLVIASSIKLIAEHSKDNLTHDKKWILNQLLFNYQFSETTIYQEVKLLAAFTILSLDKNQLSLQKILSISDYFEEKPQKWQKQIKPLSKKFISICKQYFPDEEFYISFTSGFDGRTLVSVAKSLLKPFKTFSYGRKDNDDVVVPKKNASKLKIPYKWIPLEREYIKNHYYPNALSYINNTNGGNGFLYAHVSHSAKEIGQCTKYMISGVAGSELFRAVHISGAVTSKAIIKLFQAKSYEEFKQFIEQSYELNYLKKDEYSSALDSLCNECWDYKAQLPRHLNANQQMYVFVFEEVFRKFFGNWLLAQTKYVQVRTPFLDFEFFKDLLKTNLAGAYSDFLTENPFKRFKGQIFYSEIIRQTSKTLFWQKTGKGYPPAFVRYAYLRPFLIVPFLLKRLKKKVKTQNLDNLAIVSGANLSFKNSTYLNLANEFYDENLLLAISNLTSSTPEKIRDNILMYNSIKIYLQKIKK